MKLSLLLGLFLLLHAGEPIPGYRLERMSLDTGIPSTVIWCMTQDSRGFLWFGTLYGLVKYDGYQFTTYRHNPADSTSLSNDDIVSLCEDESGDLLIGTYGGGLNLFSRRSGVFTRFLPDERTGFRGSIGWCMMRDRDGMIWIGTEAGLLTRFNPEDKSLSVAATVPHPIISLLETRTGDVYLGTAGGGLNTFDRASGDVTHVSGDSLSVFDPRSVPAMCEDSSGMLWIGTRGRGLIQFNPQVSRFTRPTTSGALPSGIITRLIDDGRGHLWIATSGGISRFSKSDLSFSTLANSSSDGMKGNMASALVCDRSGIVWICSYDGGLYRLVPDATGFLNLLNGSTATSFATDQRDRIWIGTESGLFLADRTTIRFAVGNPLDSLLTRPISCLAFSGTETLLVGTNIGLLTLDITSGEGTLLQHNQVDTASVSSNVITALYADQGGAAWVGTADGLNHLEPGTGRFTRFTHRDNDPHALGSNTILSLHKDGKGRLWVGSYAGLSVLDTATGAFINFAHRPSDTTTLSNNYVLDVEQDEQGQTWIGTGGGLNLFNPADSTFRHFYESDGLPNDVIYQIRPETGGILWLSTNRGISRFDTRQETFKNFDVGDGLGSNMFRSGASLMTAGGKLLFGSVNGVTAFVPDSVLSRRSTFVPPMTVTSFRINGSGREIPPEGLTEPVELGRTENSLIFRFAALDFTNPPRNLYSYRLVGLDNHWSLPVAEHEAHFTNLDPGDYRFEVRGTNHDGVWNDVPATLSFRIIPAWWQRTVAKILFGVSLIVGTIVVIRMRVQSRVARALELDAVRREEAENVRKKASSDFHDELGHRLTKIALFTEIVKRQLEDAPAALVQYLDAIIEDARRLTNDARDFVWTLDPAKDSLFDLVQHLREFGEEAFQPTGIAFTPPDISDELHTVKLSMDTRHHLTLIFKEGMNNVLKHAQCKNVTLSARLSNQTLVLSLVDDGRGITANDPKSSSYGLHNMKHRAEKIRSAIAFDSAPGRGSRLTVTLATDGSKPSRIEAAPHEQHL